MNNDYLLGIISNIEQQKKKKCVIPKAALREEIMSELYKEMQQCLTNLLKDKKIKYQKTLNSWAVSTTKI